MGTPLSRWVDWYDALTPELRRHLAAHLSVPGLPELERTIGSRLSRVAREPSREADLAVRLVVRTDAVLSDPAIRDAWVTGEGRVIARTMEWMRAVEEWGSLRARALAGRRIERWLAKRVASAPHRP